MPYWVSRSAVAEAASAVRLPTAAIADSGRVGCAIFAFASANLNGFSCVLVWQPRQVFSVTGRRPARAAPALSRMTASGMYSLPGPWQDSQPTPSVRSCVFATGAPGPPPVAWHFRQAGESCGSSTPAFFASSAARGVESTAYACACGLMRQRLSW